MVGGVIPNAPQKEKIGMKKYIKSILAPRAAALAADYFFVPCNLGPSSAYSVRS